MDKRRSALNVSISIVSRLILLVATFLVRRLLIQYVGNDVNGLNSLYSSIIGMLSVAELGVGSAISYSMYKPIVDGDKQKVTALYCLYKRLYWIIGGVILGAGLLVMPFLPNLISDYRSLEENVYLTFFLCLVSVLLTYTYGAKSSLIMAHKDDYITTGILTIGSLFGRVLQGGAILLFRSFPVYLGCHIVETCLVCVMMELVVRKRHEEIVNQREEVDKETRQELSRNIKAMFMHKIGGVLVYSVDNVIISAFIGVMILGKYSNYALISIVMTGTISLFFSSLTSVIGHLCSGGNKAEIRENYSRFYKFNFALGVIFFLGYYAVIDDVILMCFGSGLELSRAISFIIALNGFIGFLRSTTLLFRNASGAFYYDRWKPLAEIIMNLVLSLIFVNVFPDEYKVVGVVVATIIVVLLISDVIEPYVLHRRVFGVSVKYFWIKNYACIALFVGGLIAVTFLAQKNAGLIMNGIISIGVSIFVLGVACAFGMMANRIYGREAC